MVGSQREQHFVDQNDVLEVIDDGLAVEKVHGASEPVPVEALGRPQRPRTAGDVGNGNNLLEGDDLYSGNNDDHVNVAHEQGTEEDTNHDERPKRPRPEVCLFLFILDLSLLGSGWFLPLGKKRKMGKQRYVQVRKGNHTTKLGGL